MRYNKIRKMDVSNGPGIRVSIFLQGCEFHCKNCFNPETWSFKSGKEFTNETINKILELSDKETVSGLSILGGEPMHPKNIEGTIELAKKFKEKFPKKTIWVWSGFLYDDILKRNPEIFDYIDVMVDGQYVDELHDPTLRWKGSSNQRVIDIKKTQKSGKIVLNTD
jgi:anaerobic ribonucleoside-triphosphate reductase activating protein